MGNQIHPTAVIDPAAHLEDEVKVGPYCVVGPNVRIGQGTELYSHVVVEGHTTLGRHNRIHHHATLGQEPQDLKFKGESAELIIGDHNDIREHVSVHIGTENGGGSTTIGSHNLIMVGCHVAHDSHLGDRVIMANNVLMAGHINIEDYAVVSGGAAIHHFITIGQYSFVGGVSGVVRDVPPYMIVDGHHARVRGVNVIGLQRHQFTPQAIDRLKAACRHLYLKPKHAQAHTIGELLDQWGDCEHVRYLCDFARRAGEGVHGRQTEAHRKDDKRAARPK